MVIIDGTTADCAALVALDKRNFPAGDWFDRRLWTRILADAPPHGDMLTLVAREQGHIVGAIVGRFRAARSELVIWSIAVDEPLRGTGLAQRLLAELVTRTPTAYRSVSLDARRDNDRARRFYHRLGFAAARTIPGGYADGMDAIRYTTSLDHLREALTSVTHP